jgi:hypothetical protein
MITTVAIVAYGGGGLGEATGSVSGAASSDVRWMTGDGTSRRPIEMD